MREILAVGLGGFLGSVARYALSGAVTHWTGSSAFPFGTLAVNLAGCFVIGVLGGAVEHLHWFSAQWRIFLFTGILGGFTTFSSFGLESWYLIRTGSTAYAVANALCSLVGGVLLVAVGFQVSRWLMR